MKCCALRSGLLALLLTATPCALAQNFGANSTQLRDVSTAELFKPAIPSDEVGDPEPEAPPNPGDPPIIVPTVPRPVYLVMRYYSCQPWYPTYVRDVVTDAVATNQYQIIIDTAGANGPTDNAEGQIVTDINHPAYGLYCLRIAVAIPYDQWLAGPCRRFYVRWAYGAPYYCWLDHWWYYWRRPCVSFPLTGGQEVEPTGSAATGTATICRVGSAYTYTVTFQGLQQGITASHIHGPAGPGVNAGIMINLNTAGVAGQTAGTFSGTFTADANQAAALASGQTYVNIHSGAFPGGEIRGQVSPVPTAAIWCPWGPSWWPWMSWNRIYDVWGLTVSHPYCYAWHPSYIPRPFCLYGLQHYYTPLGANSLAVRSPAQDPSSQFAVPLSNQLGLAALAAKPWAIYDSVFIGGQPLRPILRYWPYRPYCSRWYWWRPTPFTLYRYNPPVIRFGLWQSPSGLEPGGPLPDQPDPNLEGTVGCFTIRPVVAIPADTNGDGFINSSDQAHTRQQVGTRGIDSFFDVFTELNPQ